MAPTEIIKVRPDPYPCGQMEYLDTTPYDIRVHGRQPCLAHLIRRARGLAERKEPELAWFDRRIMAAWQRLVHWAQAPPTVGAVQTW